MKTPLHKLRIPDNVAKLVGKMHPHLKKKVKASLQSILSDPYSGKALKDELAGLRSVRVRPKDVPIYHYYNVGRGCLTYL